MQNDPNKMLPLKQEPRDYHYNLPPPPRTRGVSTHVPPRSRLHEVDRALAAQPISVAELREQMLASARTSATLRQKDLEGGRVQMSRERLKILREKTGTSFGLKKKKKR